MNRCPQYGASQTVDPVTGERARNCPRIWSNMDLRPFMERIGQETHVRSQSSREVEANDQRKKTRVAVTRVCQLSVGKNTTVRDMP